MVKIRFRPFVTNKDLSVSLMGQIDTAINKQLRDHAAMEFLAATVFFSLISFAISEFQIVSSYIVDPNATVAQWSLESVSDLSYGQAKPSCSPTEISRKRISLHRISSIEFTLQPVLTYNGPSLWISGCP